MSEIKKCNSCEKRSSCALKRSDSDVEGCSQTEQAKATIPKIWNPEENQKEEIIE
jgi:hypothetical protein